MNKHHFEKEPREDVTLAEFETVMKAVLAAKVDEPPRSVNRTPTKKELETCYKLIRTGETQ